MYVSDSLQKGRAYLKSKKSCFTLFFCIFKLNDNLIQFDTFIIIIVLITPQGGCIVETKLLFCMTAHLNQYMLFFKIYLLNFAF